MQKTEKHINCIDCKTDWIDECPLCKSTAWQIRKKDKTSTRCRTKNGAHSPGGKRAKTASHDFTCSKRARRLISKGHAPECACCGTDEVLTFDHIIPTCKGGPNTDSNGQILCIDCNWLKGSKIIKIYDLRKLAGVETIMRDTKKGQFKLFKN